MVTKNNKSIYPQLTDARSYRGIFARGHAKYNGPGKAPKPGNVFNVQKAAKKRLKKMNDMRRVGR